jgi:hypothetical protein
VPWCGPTEDRPFPSLGWALLDLYEDTFIVPAGALYMQPLRFTDEQAAFVVRFYALDPATGRRIYRRAGYRRSKGAGKSPMAGAICGGELFGPVVFDGWDANGEPVGRPRESPFIQIVASAEDQTDNTFLPIHLMFEQSPKLDELGIEVGRTRIFKKSGPGEGIVPVTSASGTREGQPIHFAVLDEPQLWLPSNGGPALAAVLRRNVAKADPPGQTLETGNAYVVGQNSVAEMTEKAAKKGQRGLLYDTRDAPEVDDLADREKMMPALKHAYGDSTWVDLERIFEEANDDDTDPADARQFYLNQPNKGGAVAFDVKRWGELAHPEVVVEDQALVVLGFKGNLFATTASTGSRSRRRSSVRPSGRCSRSSQTTGATSSSTRSRSA